MAYLEQWLVDDCVRGNLHFVQFLVKLWAVVVDVFDGDDNASGRRQFGIAIITDQNLGDK